MSPLMQWLREAPRHQRRSAAVAGVAALALLAWLVVPSGSDGGGSGLAGRPDLNAGDASRGLSVGSTDPGQPSGGPSSTPGGASPAVEPGAVAASGGLPPIAGTAGPHGSKPITAGGGRDCGGLTASDRGVTATTVTVAIGDLDIVDPALKKSFGYRSDTKDIVDALVDDINRRGGVACRKLVTKIYKLDPFNPDQQQAQCIDATETHPVFAFLDPGFLSTLATQKCVTVDHRVPLLNTYPWPASYFREQAPYFLSDNVTGNDAARNWVLGAHSAGFFDRAKGFTKLSLLTCQDDGGLTAEIRRNLAAIGVTSIKTHELGCVNGILAPANEITEAAVSDSSAGVTHVFPVTSYLNMTVYLNAAKSQGGYRPTYSASDLYGLAYPAFTEDFDPDQWAGTVGYTSSRSGELRNGRPSPETTRCDAVLRAHDVPGITSEWDDFPRVYCDLLHLFTVGMDRVSANPTRLTLSRAIQTAGRVGFSGVSDGIYDRLGTYNGANFVRTVIWRRNDPARACDRGSPKDYDSNGCWFVLDPTFRPSS